MSVREGCAIIKTLSETHEPQHLRRASPHPQIHPACLLLSHAALEVLVRVEALVAPAAKGAAPPKGALLPLLRLGVGVVHVLAAVVPPPGLLVPEHLVGARNLLEVRLCLFLVLGVLVGVPPLRQLVVGLLDLHRVAPSIT